MIIDCHGHYTTAPRSLLDWRRTQLAAWEAGEAEPEPPVFDDAEVRTTLEGAQLRLQRERGTDLTIFSPIAGQMGHHLGDEGTSRRWSRVCNDLIAQACRLYPDRLAGTCQLPQAQGVSPANCIDELRRCVEELSFVGCNLNPDPSGGWWREPPLTDRHWYPLYEALVELDVPAMIHVSGSCNPCFHHTGAHYLNADTTAFMQLLLGDLFQDFPSLRLIIPHGGGAVPYHWGRYRGLAQDLGRRPLPEMMGENIFFDTCVYHHAGVGLLTGLVPVDNVLFASEMIGAVKGIDPETGHHFDDTRRYVDAAAHLSEADRRKIYEDNARRVFPRLDRLAA